MRMIFASRPNLRKLRPVFQNVVNCSAFDQPFVVECDRAVYPVGHFTRRFAYEHESTPLNLQHVFKPGLHPAAD
ncbi:MAG: hypothetical protein DME85_10270 [Verrucomicrobia bacterium]|nr:MAG: hypothetical protein DME85_10270 [Verrucomicrobiota bacterium]